MKAKIAVIAGDGVGPEVVAQATKVLETIATKHGHAFELQPALFGGIAIDATGKPLPDETLSLCKESDAILLGAVGGPKWDPPAKARPEQGLLALRKELNLYANLRPVFVQPALLNASTLKPEVLKGVDLLLVRELTGGIYFGEKKRFENGASDLCSYTVGEIQRVVRVAGRAAMKRQKRVTSVDKNNVLETSRLWREVTTATLRAEFPAVELSHLLVDACAMHLIRAPNKFDVIVTENLFGDILSDEAAMLCGSIGMLPSASLGDGRRGLYEPIHGSAPDIAGRGIANPYGTILSAAMLLRHSLNLETEAAEIEAAVAFALANGVLTADLVSGTKRAASTEEAGAAVVAAITKPQTQPGRAP
jgi:3-isopropylmalate dehydrogenase